MHQQSLQTAQLYLFYSELFGKERGPVKYTDKAANYIDLNYMKNITVEEIADDMSVNRRYLSRIFKRDYGMTVKEYITKTRMSHALRLLEEGYRVKETSMMCGYNEVFNFSKMFKKYHSFSPSDVKHNKD